MAFAYNIDTIFSVFGQPRKKVVMSQRRYECVYKRIADANVPFCEKGGTVKWVTDFSCKRKIGTSETCSDVAFSYIIDTLKT